MIRKRRKFMNVWNNNIQLEKPNVIRIDHLYFFLTLRNKFHLILDVCNS